MDFENECDTRVFFSPFSDFLLSIIASRDETIYMSFNTYIKISLIFFIPLRIGDFCNGWKLPIISRRIIIAEFRALDER